MIRARSSVDLGLLAVTAATAALPSCASQDFGEEGDDDSAVKAAAAMPRTQCDVIIAGGSTAALSAALAAATHGAKVGISDRIDVADVANQQHVCLIEPTDWLGGQLTASLVSAIDFSHQKDGRGREVGPEHIKLINNSPLFHQWIANVGAPKADCWVSRSGCFVPLNMLNRNINPRIKELGGKNLTVFRESVVKNVETSGRNITAVTIIERTAKPGMGGYDRFLSQDIEDWYSTSDSTKFSKKVTRITGRGGRAPVVIDATEFGDVLVLSGASYLQGVEEINSSKVSDEWISKVEGGDLNASGPAPYVVDRNQRSRVGNRPPWGEKQDAPACAPGEEPRGDGKCRGYDETGQQTVFPFIARLNSGAVTLPPPPVVVRDSSRAWYKPLAADWDRVWRYRRIKGSAATAAIGDLSLQNYNPGNDYPFAYMFLGMERTEAQKSDWKGGLDVDALRGAEAHSYGWFLHLRENAPAAFKDKVSLDPTGVGTKHGLSKLPYVRDTRRSIGYDTIKRDKSGKEIPGSDQFVLKYRHLSQVSANGVTAFPFKDAIAIGSYVVDVHPLVYAWKPNPTTDYLSLTNTIPYFIPLRSLTNRDFDNLLVAGKTMAQTFHANAAIRLQPQEWNTGAAAGVTAAHMRLWDTTTRRLVDGAGYKDIQAIVSGKAHGVVHGRISWNLGGANYGP